MVIGVDLTITDLPALVNWSGLDNLISANYFTLQGNPALVGLTGLGSLTTLIGGLIIDVNPILTSLTGLNNLNTIGGELFINDNPLLSDLSGLQNLTSITYDFQISQCGMLENLIGLENLIEVGGLIIGNNPLLVNFSGLEGLSMVGSYFVIANSPLLESISDLESLDSIGGDITIMLNPLLTNCNIQAVCDNLANPDAVVTIDNNATGCNNQEEVEEACSSEPCPPGNVTFSSQAEVDNFLIQYPTCTVINGNVVIEGSDISNLDGLINLTAISENLLVRSNTILTNLSGLDNLSTTGGFLWIDLNPGLTDITALGNLTSVGEELYITVNESLESIIGLENLNTVGGALIIVDNAMLIDLSGLDNLNNIGTFLNIANNTVLESIAALENTDLSTINIMYLLGNPLLSYCNIQSVCNYLNNPDAVADIENNAEGCNSPEEVEAACTVGISDLNKTSSISIYPNPTQNELFISSDNGIVIDKINIFNQIGQNVIHQNRYAGSIDVSSLMHGIYFVEVVVGNERVREKLVIR